MNEREEFDVKWVDKDGKLHEEVVDLWDLPRFHRDIAAVGGQFKSQEKR